MAEKVKDPIIDETRKKLAEFAHFNRNQTESFYQAMRTIGAKAIVDKVGKEKGLDKIEHVMDHHFAEHGEVVLDALRDHYRKETFMHLQGDESKFQGASDKIKDMLLNYRFGQGGLESIYSNTINQIANGSELSAGLLEQIVAKTKDGEGKEIKANLGRYAEFVKEPLKNVKEEHKSIFAEYLGLKSDTFRLDQLQAPTLALLAKDHYATGETLGEEHYAKQLGQRNPGALTDSGYKKYLMPDKKAA
jgi:hypothetical protein